MKEEGEEIGDAVVMILEDIPDELIADASRAAEILNIDPTGRRFEVVYGANATSRYEIAVLSRSVMEIMAEFGANKDLPLAEIHSGRASTTVYNHPDGGELQRMVHIEVGEQQPPDAYLAVKHRGYWFWIEDTDLATKSVFSFLNILTQLSSSSSGSFGPVVTIGAGN